MKRLARMLALSCAFAASAAPSLAAAAPGDSPAQKGDDADEKASRLMSAGNKAFREGNFAEAERAYRDALAVKGGYDIAGNLGAALLAQGKTKEAAQHLAFTLRLFPITGEPALRAQMQKAFDQARKGLALLQVKVGVPGAHVTVDGARVGDAPLLDGVFVDPGEHDVDAALEGFSSAPRHVTAEKDATVEVTVTLAPLRAPLALPEARPEPKRSIVPGLAIGGVALLGLVGGGVFLGLSASRKSEAQAVRTSILAESGSCVAGAGNYDTVRCPQLQDKLRADDTLHDTAVGAFVAGGVAAAGAALYFLLPSKLRVTPVAGARSGGALVTGSF